MKTRKLAVAVCAAVAANALWATSYYVAPGGDDGADGMSPSTARQTLAAALPLLTANNDELHFAKGTYEIGAEFVTELSGLKFVGDTGVARDVVLNGQGAHRFATFSKSGAAATFDSLTFSNCYMNATWVEKGAPNVCHGACVNFAPREANSGASRVFTNVVFAANTNASAYGACVYSCGSRYFGCVFENNYSLKGGAVCCWQNTGAGGALFRDCSFIGNGSGSNGCCIYPVEASSGNVYFYDCGFTNNNSLCLSKATIVSNCTFQSNPSCIAFGTGHSAVNVYDTRFYDTTGKAMSMTQAGVSLYNCTFARGGGCAYMGGSRVEEMIGCTFTNNVGGGVSADVGYMADCTFIGNSAKNSGGAWVFSAYATDLGSGTYKTKTPPYIVTNCVFRGNFLSETSAGNARALGAACCLGQEGSLNYSGPGRVRFLDCEFTDNQSTNCAASYAHGGAVFAPMGVGFEGCGFTNNAAKGYGGAFFGCATGGVVNCSFVGNSAAGNNSHGNGGALALMTGPRTGASATVISNCTFKGNSCNGTAQAGGGAICVRRANPVIVDCTFESNECKWNTLIGGGAIGFALNVNGPYGSMDNGYAAADNKDVSCAVHLLVDRCVFTGNTVRGGGGAIMATQNIITNGVTPQGAIRNSLFVRNVQGRVNDDSLGGAIRLEDQAIAIENCTFVGNSSQKSGGGVYVGGSNAALTNCLFWANTAPADADWHGGDGMSVFKCHVTADGDPKFADAANDDYTLSAASPCRNAGANAPWMVGATYLNPTNPKRTGRIAENIVDIGCYEYWPVPGILLMVR